MILHVDMDAFFAAVEQRDDPSLRGKPVLVGGTPDQRGVVAAASYEARPFGVRSAMPMSTALRLCPHAIIRPGRYSVYRQVAQQIRGIFNRFTPRIEPLSLDEAFLDVAGCEASSGDPLTIAKKIKQAVARECGLVASVGIAPVKFVAKLASDHGKPDGLVYVSADQVLEFLRPLPVRRLWGVGQATAKQLARLRIETVGQIAAIDPHRLEDLLGSHGRHLWELANGIDPRPVETSSQPKSVSHETTFAKDLTDPVALSTSLHSLTDQVCSRLREQGLAACGVTIKIRFADFRTITRSVHWEDPSDGSQTIWRHVKQLWEENRLWMKSPIRLLGVAATGLTEAGERQPLLFGEEERERENKIDAVMDQIRQRFGAGSLSPADLLKKRKGKGS